MRYLKILLIVLTTGCGSSQFSKSVRDDIRAGKYPGPCEMTLVSYNHVTKYKYDNLGRVIKIFGKGFEIELQYNENSNIIRKRIRNEMINGSFDYEWDEFNSLKKVTFTPKKDPNISRKYKIDLSYTGTHDKSKPLSFFDYFKMNFHNTNIFRTRFTMGMLSSGDDLFVKKSIEFNSEKQPISVKVIGKYVDGLSAEAPETILKYNEKGFVKRIEQTNPRYQDRMDIREYYYNKYGSVGLIKKRDYWDGKYHLVIVEYEYDANGNMLSMKETEQENVISHEKYDYSCWLN